MGDDSFPNSLVEGPVYLFREWPNPAIPRVAAGVYTIWREGELIYAGMAGRGLTSEAIASHREAGSRSIGLHLRLSSHWAGRRSGDQFCVYVADRLILQTLERGEIGEIAAGRLSMDKLVRTYIHDHLGYRFAEAPDGRQALRWEKLLCSGTWDDQRPLLNPHRHRESRSRRRVAVSNSR